MASTDRSLPVTVATGYLALSEELRDQIRERLLGMLDATTRRLERGAEDDQRHPGEVMDLVDEIRAALIKLDAGYYGVCEMCEEPIPFERLDAIPSVRCCVTCHARPQPLVGCTRT